MHYVNYVTNFLDLTTTKCALAHSQQATQQAELTVEYDEVHVMVLSVVVDLASNLCCPLMRSTKRWFDIDQYAVTQPRLS